MSRRDARPSRACPRRPGVTKTGEFSIGTSGEFTSGTHSGGRSLVSRFLNWKPQFLNRSLSALIGPPKAACISPREGLIAPRDLPNRKSSAPLSRAARSECPLPYRSQPPGRVSAVSVLAAGAKGGKIIKRATARGGFSTKTHLKVDRRLCRTAAQCRPRRRHRDRRAR